MKTRSLTPGDFQEHLCLQRHLAALQTRISGEIAALVEAEACARARADAAETQCRVMERALITERSRAVLACTRWSWGMGGPPPQSALTPAGSPSERVSTAAEVLCQTGCQGHGHPWLEADGACRLTGNDCTRVRDPALVTAGENDARVQG